MDESRTNIDVDGHYEVGTASDVERVRVASETKVRLTGSVRRLELEALRGSSVDATGLEVDELYVVLEMCRVTARQAKSVSGWVVYGSTISVSSNANIDELNTSNAGRIDVR